MNKIFFAFLILVFCLAVSCNNDDLICIEEEISPACICPAVYDPVCGCNGKTYSNSCTAGCSGIKDFTPGECP